MNALLSWYAKERAELPQLPGGLLLGAVIYGQRYLDLFRDFCLPSLRSKANREALHRLDAKLAVYTDEETLHSLRDLLGVTKVVARVIPHEVMVGPFWPRLSAAQALLATMAARSDMAFHQLHPDHLYSDHYFPSLLALGVKHRKIAHTGLSAKAEAAPYLGAYRCPDGSLSISSKALTNIAWDYLHWRVAEYVMKDGASDMLPKAHFMLWRARDRVMLFSPHNNTAFMDAVTCRALDRDLPPTATLDALVQTLYGHDYYVPTIDDDMSFIGVEWRGNEEPPTTVMPRDEYIVRCRAHIGNRNENLVYFTRPTEMPASEDQTAPTAEEVTIQQHGIVSMLRAA